LLLQPNLWTYLPRDDRIMRIPASQLSQPWMESGFRVDDLVRHTSEVEDYDHQVLGIDASPERTGGLRAYVVEYRSRAAAGSTWGRIVAWIETEYGTPLRQEFRDADDELIRVLRYGDIRAVDGLRFPHVWTLEHVAEDLPDTRIEVERVRFDADFEDSVFTTTNLKSSQ
jgi:outer membrane lipoprotein-sorting protein